LLNERRTGARELAIAAVPAALVAFTLLVLIDPGVSPAVVSGPLDLLINAVATMVAIAVAVLGWIHYREGEDTAALLRASAFLVLATQNSLLIAASVAGGEVVLGLSLADPGQLPLWGVIVSRTAAAGLLVLAGVAALRAWVPPARSALFILALPSLGVALMLIAMAATPSALPELLTANARAQLAGDPTAPLLSAGGGLLIGLQALIGIGFLAASALAYRVYRRDGHGVDIFMSIGLVVAAFSQVHAAIHPGSYASLVTTGDLLRVVFYAVVLLALAAEAGDDVRALRRANAELLRLRDAEVERATAEERARVAREIHDGMSQELWYAKLKQGRLAQREDLSPDAQSLAVEVGAAIESALSEARQAILALQPTPGATFAQVLSRYVDDFSDRFGIPAQASCDVLVEQLPSRVQAELLRIVQEALNNTRKHADATLVRVEAAGSGAGLRLTVSDNGRGFDPIREGSGYGLRSMRERAGIIGARLTIDSRPQDGTRVVVVVPLGTATVSPEST
jgi:signal transduction histidine kinase